MLTDPTFYWVAILAVSLMGLAKGGFAGVWLVRRVEAERFYTIIYVLMIAVGAQLLWKALSP